MTIQTICDRIFTIMMILRPILWLLSQSINKMNKNVDPFSKEVCNYVTSRNVVSKTIEIESKTIV